jgi:Mn-containing catalase
MDHFFDSACLPAARAKRCKGVMGIIEEGEEVMHEGKKKENAAADLSLIAAARRVEHYESSGYSSARNLAQQLRTPVIMHLLSASLAKEKNTDQLLNRVPQSLMSAAKMLAAVE